MDEEVQQFDVTQAHRDIASTVQMLESAGIVEPGSTPPGVPPHRIGPVKTPRSFTPAESDTAPRPA